MQIPRSSPRLRSGQALAFGSGRLGMTKVKVGRLAGFLTNVLPAVGDSMRPGGFCSRCAGKP